MNKKGIAIFILLGFVMLQYQNCAESPQDFDDGSSVSTSDGVNDVIDHVDVGSVYFPQSKVTASDAEEFVQVIGTCDQSGAILSWTLKNKDGSLVERGLSDCDKGSFVIELGDEWKNHCDENLVLKAYLGAKSSSETEVETQCNVI